MRRKLDGQKDIAPKRIRFHRDPTGRWIVRASYGGLFGYVPVGGGATPEAALDDLANSITELRQRLRES